MSDEHRFVRQVQSKAARKLEAQRTAQPPAWFGLGMIGTIGWSVGVPTVAGALLGRWCDQHRPSSHSWTLALLIAGLILGCVNAWHWISTEDKAMHEPKNPS
jgi:ATP synthase protein I